VDGIVHVVAERFTDLSGRLRELRQEDGVAPDPPKPTDRMVRSRDFH
jgi:error-prone DNA polymerase